MPRGPVASKASLKIHVLSGSFLKNHFLRALYCFTEGDLLRIGNMKKVQEDTLEGREELQKTPTYLEMLNIQPGPNADNFF